tara:strand:- start:4201 stop:5103 length:903 start_codon:yes stop_codon:yes gene_type:complete
MKIDSYNSSLFNHQPVMINEIVNSIENCSQKDLKSFKGIDATMGGGGHSHRLLERFPNLEIIGIDQDPFANSFAKNHLKKFEKRIQIVNSNFADFKPKEKVSFVIADLGFNSNQVDNPERGFSFKNDGPLDMRMNPHQAINANSIIKETSEKDLADLIYKYGEEKFSRKIARKIKFDLKSKGDYSGTRELAYAISGCFPPNQRYKRIHPATRTFQALRIAVNQEIESLEKLLNISPDWLVSGGILSIISFHSIEDRLVKNYFKNDKRFLNLTKKPITPNEIEIQENKRSRSAKLRIAKKE